MEARITKDSGIKMGTRIPLQVPFLKGLSLNTKHVIRQNILPNTRLESKRKIREVEKLYPKTLA